jgi:CRP/FNR family transcriptional regulator
MNAASAVLTREIQFSRAITASDKSDSHVSESCRFSLTDLCSLLGMSLPNSRKSSEFYFQHLQFKSGQKVFTTGQEFSSIYIVHSGFLKTSSINNSGTEQILCFPMKGDIVGVDGIYNKNYKSEVTALSDCNLISLPLKTLIWAARENSELEELMYRMISSELIREQEMIGIMGSQNAESRVAFFLVQLSDRFHLMGYSAKSFILRMSREEIGSYLGLSMETVSRSFSQFDRIGAINVRARHVSINSKEALEQLYKFPESKTGNHSKGRMMAK